MFIFAYVAILCILVLTFGIRWIMGCRFDDSSYRPVNLDFVLTIVFCILGGTIFLILLAAI